MIDIDSIEGLGSQDKEVFVKGRMIYTAIQALKANGILLAIDDNYEGSQGVIVSLSINGVPYLSEVEDGAFSTENPDVVGIKWDKEPRTGVYISRRIWIFSTVLCLAPLNSAVLSCNVAPSDTGFDWKITSDIRESTSGHSAHTRKVLICSGTAETLEQAKQACKDVLVSWVKGE
jgi:hypothetical protein